GDGDGDAEWDRPLLAAVLVVDEVLLVRIVEALGIADAADHVPVHAADGPVTLVVGGVQGDGLHHGALVLEALNDGGLILGPAQGREQDRNQQREDADDHQQLDESETGRFVTQSHDMAPTFGRAGGAFAAPGVDLTEAVYALSTDCSNI